MDAVNFLSRTTLEELATVISSLGDRIEQMNNESWRTNEKRNDSTSVLSEVILKLSLNESDNNRRALYKIWKYNRHNIQQLVMEKLKVKTENNKFEETRTSDNTLEPPETNTSILTTNLSISKPERPLTRSERNKLCSEQGLDSNIAIEMSITMTYMEWRTIFSCTHQKMKSAWGDMVYNKLMNIGIKCPLKFKTPYVKKGTRKRACNFFCCFATCTINMCPRRYQIILDRKPGEDESLLFLVRINGEEKHNRIMETSSRKLSGDQRLVIGKRVDDIGPLSVFRERVENADESLVTAGNFTGCETIEILKKAAVDYRRQKQIDEDIFRECRIIAHAYSTADVTSAHLKGYVQVAAEKPLRLHLFSEIQIKSYVKYCTEERYSFVHIDATGHVLKALVDQKRIYLYTLLFKNGIDSIDTVNVAHALLGDHTVPSISYFLGDLVHWIMQVKGKRVIPSFFVMDFSAALMNACLLSFNGESIQVHLSRCWNVFCRKYTKKELRNNSFVHFCCAHVIHAIARSLSDARISKKIRRGILRIFARITCMNNLNDLYRMLGFIISTFGDPFEINSEEMYRQLSDFEFHTDKEYLLTIVNEKKIFKNARSDESLAEVDECLRLDKPIIHQSPFNQEACRLYPTLTCLVCTGHKYDQITNPMFSPSIIRIFYRWWAYLPLWTGLLWNFEERYSSDVAVDTSDNDPSMRYSNALIESYFRTMKRSIFQNKVLNRPSDAIIELYRCVQLQNKAQLLGITQSSKFRKKSRRNIIEEQWKKKKATNARRTIYFDSANTNKYTSQQIEAKKGNVYKELKKSLTKISTSFPDGSPTTVSMKSRYSESSQSIDDSDMCFSSKFRVNNEYSANLSPRLDNKASANNSSDDSEERNISYGIDDTSDCKRDPYKVASRVQHDLTPTTKIAIENFDDKLRSLDNDVLDADAFIDGERFRWPKFGVLNATYNNKKFSITNTCAIDASLFSLFFIYHTDTNFAREVDTAEISTPYYLLKQTFSLVSESGWDIARLFWLQSNKLLKHSSENLQDVFGSVDENVFFFLKYRQSYSTKIVCTRSNCKQRERIMKTREIGISRHQDIFNCFETDSIGKCSALFEQTCNKDQEEIGNREKLIQTKIINLENNKLTKGSLCAQNTFIHRSIFDDEIPALLIVNVVPTFQKSFNGDEGYEPCDVRLRDLKREISIQSTRYHLRAVINHNKISMHFTSTLIGRDRNLYVFDDLKGVQQARNSTLNIDTALYTKTDDQQYISFSD